MREIAIFGTGNATGQGKELFLPINFPHLNPIIYVKINYLDLMLIKSKVM